MIFYERKYKIFRTVRVILDDEKAIDIDKKDFSKIMILSYKQLSLKKKYYVRKKVTANIDINKDEEEILANFHKTTRNEIRKTYRIKDLKFKLLKDKQEIREAYELHKEFEYKIGRVPFPLSHFKGCLFFGAFYKKKIISLIICYDCFPYLRARAISSLRFYASNKNDKALYNIISYSSRRLIYEVCLWGRKNKYLHFDLGSINPNDEDKKNLYNFKSKFGGKIEKEYTYIYKSFLFSVFEKIVIFKLFFSRFIYRFFYFFKKD